jgi:hypothetical protein
MKYEEVRRKVIGETWIETDTIVKQRSTKNTENLTIQRYRVRAILLECGHSRPVTAFVGKVPSRSTSCTECSMADRKEPATEKNTSASKGNGPEESKRIIDMVVDGFLESGVAPVRSEHPKSMKDLSVEHMRGDIADLDGEDLSWVEGYYISQYNDLTFELLTVIENEKGRRAK